MKKKLVVITLAAAFCLPNYSFAFGLGDLTSSVPGHSGGGGDVADLEKGQGQLADETNKVLLDFATAIVSFQEALGLEADSSLKNKIANCAKGKICTESEDFEKTKSHSDEVVKTVKNLEAKGVKLSSDASKTFKKGLVSYGKGALGGSVLGLKIAEVGPKYASAVAANPLTASSTLATGTTIFKQIPPVLTMFSGASGGIYDFATYSGIEKPEEAEAE